MELASKYIIYRYVSNSLTWGLFEFWHPNALNEFDSVISKGLVTDELYMFDGCEVELDMGKWLWGLVSRAKADNYKK